MTTPHTYIHTYITYIYTYIHTYIHTHIQYIHTHIQYIHTYIHTYTHIQYIHTHIQYIHTHTHIHRYTHTYVHTHTHTYTHITVVSPACYRYYVNPNPTIAIHDSRKPRKQADRTSGPAGGAGNRLRSDKEVMELSQDVKKAGREKLTI